MALNFKDIASKKFEEIERPPLPPVGTYRWRVSKLPTIDEDVGDGKWDVLNIPVVAVEAMDNVDLDGYSGQITNIQQRISFMFNKEDEVEFEKTLFRARTFFEKHLACAGPDDNLMQAINNSVAQECLGDIAWRQDKNDPEVMHANIARTSPLD